MKATDPYPTHYTSAYARRASVMEEAADLVARARNGESVREEAERLITEDRNEAYGPAAIDYGRTVTMFNTWRNPRHGPLSTSDALMFMVFVKLSREAHKMDRENIVDAHGYLALYAQVVGHD